MPTYNSIIFFGLFTSCQILGVKKATAEPPKVTNTPEFEKKRNNSDDNAKSESHEPVLPAPTPDESLPPPPSSSPPSATSNVLCRGKLTGLALPINLPLSGLTLTDTQGAVGNFISSMNINNPVLPASQDVECGTPTFNLIFQPFDLIPPSFPTVAGTTGVFSGPIPPSSLLNLRVIPTAPIALTSLDDICRTRVYAVPTFKADLLATIPTGLFWNSPASLPAFPVGAIDPPQYQVLNGSVNLSCKTKWKVTITYTTIFDFPIIDGCGCSITATGALIVLLDENDFQITGTLSIRPPSVISSGTVLGGIVGGEIIRTVTGTISDGVAEDQFMLFRFNWNASEFLKNLAITIACPNSPPFSTLTMHPAMPVVNSWGIQDIASGVSPPAVRLPTKPMSGPISPAIPFPANIIQITIQRELIEIIP